MRTRDKLDTIFSFMENRSVANPQEAADAVHRGKLNERELFGKALIETLDNGDISYAEAEARIKHSDFAPEDKNIILASISHYEAGVNMKTASDKTEVSSMVDPIQKDIEALKQVLPAYGAWVERVVKQSSEKKDAGVYAPNPSDKAPEDSQAAKAVTDEEKYINESKSAEVERMNKTNKAVDPEKRTTPGEKIEKSADTKTHNKGLPQDLRESEVLKNHNQYDNNALDKEMQKAKEGEGVQKKETTQLQKRREEYLRAAEKCDIKFSADADAWVVSAKDTGDTILVATIKDITAGREISGDALAELKSPKFGEIIMNDIKLGGITKAAKNLLGDDMFNKLAKKHTETVKKAAIRKAEAKDKLLTLKGIYASLQESLKKASAVPTIKELFKQAEAGLGELEGAIEGGAEVMPVGEVVSPLDDLNEIGMAMEGESDLEGANDKATEAIQAIEAGDLERAEELIQDMRKEEETGEGEAEEEEESGEKPLEGGTAEGPEGGTAEGPGEELPEDFGNKEATAQAKTKTGSGIKDALTKLAKKGEGNMQGDYDVTQKSNFMAEFEHNKGNIEQDGKKFMNIDSLKKDFEAILNKKPTGKLASAVATIVKKAADGTLSDAEVYKLAFGPEYAAQLQHEYTQDQVVTEHDKNDAEFTKDNKAAVTSSDNGALKMRKAMEATELLVKKGLLGPNPTKAARDAQVDDFMKMDEKTLNAYVDTTERVVATTELEDGRFKVCAMDKPDKDDNIVEAYVDNKKVALLNGEELRSNNGIVSRAHLLRAMSLVKTAMKEGFFEAELSGGQIEDNGGEKLEGLNVGQDSAHPRVNINDLI